MKKIIINLPLLASLAIAGIFMLSQAYGQSAAAPSMAYLVEQDTVQNAEVVPTSTTGDDEENSSSGSSSGGDGVTATVVNGESFNKGDAVTISGSVGEEGSGSNSLYAKVYDPDSIELDIENLHINADGTFRYGIATDAGPFEGGLSNPMTKSGTYTVTFEYFGDSGIETGEVTFEYNAESASTTAALSTTQAAPPQTTTQTAPSQTTTGGAWPQGVEIILMENGTGVIVDNSSPNLSQNRATFNWTQTGGNPIRFENNTIILEQ